ncbi:hypothetical protein QJS10_CPB17g00180 [Acorus calamus]|uniref:C2H2-type domain-containing protein n=1 Tax=Acorus calamus TaxID=4465 RepID=A0AAV9D084_ACOCL|nr:hypothetical protein QJS10_CPB17g00180 [Acorus calamus]
MEFKFLDSDNRPLPPPPRPPPVIPSFISPSPLTNGFFTPQPHHVGFNNGGQFGGGGMVRPEFLLSQVLSAYVGNILQRGALGAVPLSAGEALLREIEKERIREDLIVSEVARRRILEEEVRRELAIGRAISVGVGQHLSLPVTAPTYNMVGDVRVSEQVLPPMSAVRIDKRVGPMGMVRHESGAVRLPIAQHSKVEVSQLSEDPPVKPAVAGMKRKAALSITDRQAPPSIKNEWSCALCQVTAPNQKIFKEHLQGKKHKAKEAVLNVNNIVAKCQAASTFTTKNPVPTLNLNTSEKPVKRSRVGDEPTSSGTKLIQKQQPFFFFCKDCNVKCNGVRMMTEHIGGKKHQALLEKANKSNETPKKNPLSAAVTAEPAYMIKGNRLMDIEEAENKANGKAKVADRKQWKRQKTGGTKERFYFFCRDCNVECYNESMMTAHLDANKHRVVQAALNRWNEALKKTALPSTTTAEVADMNEIILDRVMDTVERENKSIGNGEDGKQQWRRKTECTKNRLYFCKYCNLKFNSEKTLTEHIGAKKHRAIMEAWNRWNEAFKKPSVSSIATAEAADVSEVEGDWVGGTEEAKSNGNVNAKYAYERKVDGET